MSGRTTPHHAYRVDVQGSLCCSPKQDQEGARKRRNHESPKTNEKGIVYKGQSYTSSAACFEVYKEEVCKFLEPVYQKGVSMEFGLTCIPVQAQENRSKSIREGD